MRPGEAKDRSIIIADTDRLRQELALLSQRIVKEEEEEGERVRREEALIHNGK